MKRWILVMISALLLSGCRRYDPPEESSVQPENAAVIGNMVTGKPVKASESSAQKLEESVQTKKTRVKVKGIYVSAYVAGTRDMMDEIIRRIGETEINTVVIDVKDDEGRVTYDMDHVPIVDETGACVKYIADLPGLIGRLKEQGIYVIARVVAFRDPYLAEVRPEWSLRKADGQIYRDSKGLAWINPYRHEVWDYLAEIGTAAATAGFDEIQFDYIRFSSGKGMEDVVISEEETKGRSRTDIITEFTQYIHEKLEPTGAFVSADVFGTIIESREDAGAIGQIYAEMAGQLDYICPMIYPSHYGEGNFGLDYPDMHPYETIAGALKASKKALEKNDQVIVRPWLQDFTASYLSHYIDYGPEQLRQQIQAVYDTGYEEWILWDAKCTYTWAGLLPQTGK